MAVVRIDATLCQGHGRCYTLCDELFTEDEEGYGKVKGDGAVAPPLLDAAELAIASCPEHAIRLEEEGSQP